MSDRPMTFFERIGARRFNVTRSGATAALMGDECNCKSCSSDCAGIVPCVHTICQTCAGAGQSLLSSDPCVLCNGTGVRP